MPLEHRNFTAWISCDGDGDILEEYKATPDSEDEKVYTCWVASEAGKNFTVHWKSFMKDVCDNRGTVSVDGVETHSYVNLSSSNKDGGSSGVKVGEGELRPYSFSDVTLTDDEAYLGVEQSTDTRELGNITLKIHLVNAYYQKVKYARRRNPIRRRKEIDLYDGAIHETTKKICDHRITLGDAIPFGPPRNGPQTRKLVWEPLDQHDMEPHVTFHFKYRPRSFLQAQGILPLPVSMGTTPQKPISTNVDNQGQQSKQHTNQKRKRPLMDRDSSLQNILTGRESSNLSSFLPSPSLHQASLLPSNSRAIHYETPRKIKEDEDMIISGYLEDTYISQECSSSRNVRTKREYASLVRPDSLRLWRVSYGVIDLTMED